MAIGYHIKDKNKNGSQELRAIFLENYFFRISISSISKIRTDPGGIFGRP